MIDEKVNQGNIGSMCRILSERDEDLARIQLLYGTPPVWERRTGYYTLVQIILEQQVSLSSAKAAFKKLNAAFEELTPENFLTLDDIDLKAIGFSRQKASYVRGLSEAVLNKRIEIDGLENLPDDAVRRELIKIRGIGDWTADIYLLMAMGRPDVMPRNDLALLAAYRDLKKLKDRPAADDFLRSAAKWRPFRSVAARLLWHFYLSEKSKGRAGETPSGPAKMLISGGRETNSQNPPGR